MNGYEEHFDGFLIPFVDEGNDPEMKSALDLHGIGGAQSILSIPALGLMDGSVVEGRPNRYLSNISLVQVAVPEVSHHAD